MYRIKKSALVSKNNKLFYRYKPFTGIVFDVVDQQVLDIFEYKDGEKDQEYQSQFIYKNDNDLCVDFEALAGEDEEEYEPFLYKGNRYTGLYYEFENDFCVTECRCVDGIPWEDVGWYETGNLESFWTSMGNNSIFQSYNWYENDLFERIKICKSEKHTLEINFTEKQEITTIRVPADYLKNSPEFEHHLKYHYLSGYSLPEEALIATRLFASGPGIDDKFFSNLQSCAGFSEMETILIYMTSISIETLLSLENHPALKNISVNDEREEIIQATKNLKLK